MRAFFDATSGEEQVAFASGAASSSMISVRLASDIAVEDDISSVEQVDLFRLLASTLEVLTSCSDSALCAAVRVPPACFRCPLCCEARVAPPFAECFPEVAPRRAAFLPPACSFLCCSLARRRCTRARCSVTRRCASTRSAVLPRARSNCSHATNTDSGQSITMSSARLKSERAAASLPCCSSKRTCESHASAVAAFPFSSRA
mmetsp:Transcript_9778/g.30143  ORF Transcript_9778/g.30143 Transcript_9778/m.30143 type:complete len:203 (+) Transcript_9778:887-1495(+)